MAGTVQVNGRDRSKEPREWFPRLSCYIMQDDALRPALTVREAMTLVAHLRLGYCTSHKQKRKQVGYHDVRERCVNFAVARGCAVKSVEHSRTHTNARKFS